MRQAPPSSVAKAQRPFDLRALIRLAGWGTSAALALLLAALSGHSESGAARMQVPVPSAGASDPALHGRDREDESRRLADSVRRLNTERETLLKRINALEQSLADIT